MKPFRSITKLNPAWWRRFGERLADKIRVHTHINALDVDDRPFRKLSAKYAARKAAGGSRFTAQKPIANLKLTGDLQKDLQHIKSGRNFTLIGWPSDSEKLAGLQKRGRVVTTRKKPVSGFIERWIQREIDRETNRNVRKTDGKKIHHLKARGL